MSNGNSVYIKEIADQINHASKQKGFGKLHIRLSFGNDERKFGMNSSLFFKDFNWKPKISINEDIHKLVHMDVNKKQLNFLSQ